MREIEFRAKNINDQWRYGYLERQDLLYDENYDCSSSIQIETLGQYTGLTDKNGTKIFEGDIVKLSSELTLDNFDGFIGQVKFELGGFNIVNGYKGDSVFQDCRDIEVIGNIYDNPELLEVE